MKRLRYVPSAIVGGLMFGFMDSLKIGFTHQLEIFGFAFIYAFAAMWSRDI